MACAWEPALALARLGRERANAPAPWLTSKSEPLFQVGSTVLARPPPAKLGLVPPVRTARVAVRQPPNPPLTPGP